MQVFILCALLASTALAQLHNVCHSNDDNLREEEVVALFADLADHNGDGRVTTAEILVFFFDLLKIVVPVPRDTILLMDRGELFGLAAFSGIAVDRDHFVTAWHERFRDSRDFVRATFDAYDENKDGKLNALEFEHIVNHVLQVADDGDGQISHAEFKKYLLFIYNNC